jgi:hypothetical protein
MQPLWKVHQVQGKTRGRLFIAAVLCGPLSGLLIVLIISVIYLLMNLQFTSFFPFEVFLFAAMYGAGIGWPAMLLFGLPAHAFLYRRRSHKIGGYLLSGALLGILATVVITLLQILSTTNLMGFDLLYSGGVLGVILLLCAITGAGIFWWIRRPDRDVPSPEKLAAAFE